VQIALERRQNNKRQTFVAPCCGRHTTVLYPPDGSGRRPVTAAAQAEWGYKVDVARVLPGAALAVELPDLPGGLSWACSWCRTGLRGSIASRRGRVDRAVKAAAKAFDPRRGQRRAGESWAEVDRREARIAVAKAALAVRMDAEADRLRRVLKRLG
jgi:hypothetical protein